MDGDMEFPPESSMNDPKRRFFSGDTLQQAVIQAANYFNLDPSYVAYRSLEKRHGFLKTRRKVVIEVDPDNPRRETPVPLPAVPGGRAHPPPPPSSYLSREPAAPMIERPDPPPPRIAEARPQGGGRERGRREERGGRREGRGGQREGHERPRRRREEARLSRPVRDAESPGPAVLEDGGLVTLPETPRRVSERFPLAAGPLAEAAAKAAALLIRVAGLELAPQIFQGEDRLEVDLSGADVDWCFADDGEFVMAVEHLLPRMIRSLCGEAMAVRVDCDNFHEIREERLRSLAQRMAEDVRRRGRPRILEPMNPADRRIIHVTLADDPGVVTESEGDGYFKRVTIRPV